MIFPADGRLVLCRVPPLLPPGVLGQVLPSALGEVTWLVQGDTGRGWSLGQARHLWRQLRAAGTFPAGAFAGSLCLLGGKVWLSRGGLLGKAQVAGLTPTASLEPVDPGSLLAHFMLCSGLQHQRTVCFYSTSWMTGLGSDGKGRPRQRQADLSRTYPELEQHGGGERPQVGSQDPRHRVYRVRATFSHRGKTTEKMGDLHQQPVSEAAPKSRLGTSRKIDVVLLFMCLGTAGWEEGRAYSHRQCCRAHR